MSATRLQCVSFYQIRSFSVPAWNFGVLKLNGPKRVSSSTSCLNMRNARVKSKPSSLDKETKGATALVVDDIAGEPSGSGTKDHQSITIKENEIQSLGEKINSLETLTVQELREMMRQSPPPLKEGRFELPIRGRKQELVLVLKSYLASHVENRDPETVLETTTRKGKVNKRGTVVKEKESLSEKVETVKVKRSRKRTLLQIATLEDDSKVASMEQEKSTKADVIVARAKRKATATVQKKSTAAVETAVLAVGDDEPWTVLAHKKPQPGWVPYNPRIMRPPPPSAGTGFVKLVSWNVNGLRALLKLEGFSALQLAQKEDFDVLCLQETKLQEKDVEDIKKHLLEGYESSFWTCSVSKLGYAGTALISRIKPHSIKYGLGIPDHDGEGRLITMEFDSFYLISGYVPNSGDGLKRLAYRINEWDPSLANYMKLLYRPSEGDSAVEQLEKTQAYLKELEKSKPVILTGDLNCAYEEIDIYNPAGNRRSAGFTDEERQSFAKNFLSKGFVDTFRRQHPGVVGYTYWGFRHGGRRTNKGWRLDYFLVSESIADKVHDSYILPDVLGSDHCPIGLILKP